MLHELAHACGCVITRTDIHEIQFWQWQNYLDWEADNQRPGFIRHDHPGKPWQSVLISAMPLPVCFSCGALLYIIADFLAYPSSLLAFGLGSVFLFSMGLSQTDLGNIERYTADLTGIEAWIWTVFARLSRNEGLLMGSIPAGAFLLLDLPLWTIVLVGIWHLCLEVACLSYDWWHTQ
ncbi:hypothetical protein [Haloarcula laminariae]|uniref:hypothetical protein n=1 Tax=Haloarcula laminariae TaxID=2961577 RepID=UPI0021C9F499|nr:hypothetical protein [Halomicroarcula laminariae]